MPGTSTPAGASAPHSAPSRTSAPTAPQRAAPQAPRTPTGDEAGHRRRGRHGRHGRHGRNDREHRDPAATPSRDPFFDNAKYLAIVLVAVGHAWEPLRGSRTVEALYLLVYTLHMPAFIIISGYFSRRFDPRPDRLRRLVTSVAVPYVIFETGYALFRRWVGDDPTTPVTLLDPWFLTWFLPALFVWRLTTPLWRRLRAPLPVTLAIAALASLSPSIGEDLDLQRVLQFLPFFVVGLSLRPEHVRLLERRGARLLTLPVLAAAALLAYGLAPRMNYEWLYRYASAQELGAPWWAGPVMTLALFACSLALTACFLAWVPRRRRWFTALGTGTLYGYLLHGFLVKGALYQGWYDHAWVHGRAGALVVTVAAGAAVTLLCTGPVRRGFRWAVEPELRWAFGNGAPAPPAGNRNQGPAQDQDRPQDRNQDRAQDNRNRDRDDRSNRDRDDRSHVPV